MAQRPSSGPAESRSLNYIKNLSFHLLTLFSCVLVQMTSVHVGARVSPGSQGFHPTSLATSEKGKHLFPSSSSKTPRIECLWTGLVTSPALIHCDKDGSWLGPCLEPTLEVEGGVGAM